MMVVLSISCCPPSLRGDVSKWLFEIDAGVYAGRVTSRVKDELWERVDRTAGDGHAVMVYSTLNEQRFGFHVHNGRMVPTEFDGITLMLNPYKPKNESCPLETESKRSFSFDKK